MATTLIELENRVRAILDEATPGQWSPENIRRWCNDGLRDLARTTRHYKGKATVPLTPDVAEYTMAENILAIEHAYYDDGNRMRPLTARHWESMDQVWGSWQDRTAAWPTWFTTRGNAPALILRLYPVPSQPNHNAQLLTVVLPTEMALTGDDGTNVDVPPGWIDLIVDYAEMLALRRDRDPRWQEAHQAYVAKRNDMIHSNDYMAVNRELVPDPTAGYVPAWHLDDDDFGWL